MITIHKYTVEDSRNTVRTHEGARLLHVAAQHGVVAVWARVDTARPVVHQDLAIVVTGGEVPTDAVYVGTALDGIWVLHVFMVGEMVTVVDGDHG